MIGTRISSQNRIASVNSIERLTSWLPVDALIEDGQPAIEWMDMAEVDCREPFLFQTIERVRKERKVQTTGLEALLEFEKVSDSLSPSGFIFHTSRSGSTLVANACRTLNDSLVISEAPVIPKLIGRLFTDTEGDKTKELLYLALLRAAVSALGQRRSGTERNYFIKFTSTCFLQFANLRRIWPRVPALFLYRHPVEVMVSNLKRIPSWLEIENDPAVSAAIIGIQPEQLFGMSREEYCARALGQYYAAAESLADENTMLLDYDELSLAKLLSIIRFFGIEPSREEIDKVTETARLDAKDPHRSDLFHPDGGKKRDEASEYVIQLAEEWAMPAYLRLTKRQTSSTPAQATIS